MIYGLLADAVLLLHLAFVVFVVFGAFVVWRFPRLAWLHLPSAIWGAFVELAGYPCPLTPLENYLRRLSGATGFRGGFVEHYLVPAIYPEALLREGQIMLGIGVIAINIAAYVYVWRRRAAKRHDHRRR